MVNCTACTSPNLHKRNCIDTTKDGHDLQTGSTILCCPPDKILDNSLAASFFSATFRTLTKAIVARARQGRLCYIHFTTHSAAILQDTVKHEWQTCTAAIYICAPGVGYNPWRRSPILLQPLLDTLDSKTEPCIYRQVCVCHN